MSLTKCSCIGIFATILAAVSSSTIASIDSSYATVQVGRYSSLIAEPTEGQSDLLQTVVHTKFPHSLINVGEAIEYLLMRSGYRLADFDAADPAMLVLASRPLPEAHRELGPMPLEEALITLAGPVFRLVVDPLNRLISYEVVEKYKLLMPSEAELASLRASLEGELYSHPQKGLPEDEKITVFLQDDTYYSPMDTTPYVPDNQEAQNEQTVESMSELEPNVYGPTTQTDTLYQIAKTQAHVKGVSIHRMMYGIFRLNQAAFGKVNGDRNINKLYGRVFLKIPTDDYLASLKEDDALAFVSAHNEKWESHG